MEGGPLGKLLTKVVAHIAHHPIRTRGTFCGSIAHADPASEWCAVVAALDGKMVVRSVRGARSIAARDYFAGLMTTIHSYTNDQVLTDVFHSDLRRARSATMSQIPTKTGAAAAVGLVMPELKGKLDGLSIRVPTINVSLVDLTFTAKRATSVEEVNKLMRAASASANLKGVLAYTEEPLVSTDFNHDPHSSIFDGSLTKVIEGTLVKVFSWYDNEWGFSNRMLDTTLAWSKVS